MSDYKDRMSDFKIHKNTLLKYTGGAEHLIIPEGITDIGPRVFMERSMVSVEFPSALEFIGQSAFHECTRLEKVILPESVKFICYEAFSSCDNLTELVLAPAMEELGDFAFMGCHFLKEVVIPEGLTCLNRGIFQYCMSLEKITIPDSVTTFGEDPFAMCGSLETVVCTKGSITDYYFQMVKHGAVSFEYTGQSKNPLDLNRFFV